MKHLCKKGLSLFLAILMVVSMLPVDALAAAFISTDEDQPARREEPVLDRGDPIVDTLSGRTSRVDSDRDANVEIPDVGDEGEDGDEPAHPLWVDLPLDFEIDQSGNYTVKVLPNAKSGGGGSGNNAYVVLLDRAGPGGVAPGVAVGPLISADTNNVGLMTSAVGGVKLPSGLYDIGGDQTFTFALDGSYNGEVLTGNLGSFDEFLAAAQEIDSTVTTEIPLRIILVTQAGDSAGVSQMTYTWKAGKNAVLKANSLNGGTQQGDEGGVVPGDGYIELTNKKTDDMDFYVLPTQVVDDATLTISNVVYTGIDADNLAVRWIDMDSGSPQAGWPSGLGENDDYAGYRQLRLTFTNPYDVWQDPSGLIEGTITITYSVDGVGGSARTLEIPVRTKPIGVVAGTKITVQVKQGNTAVGGYTTLTSTVGAAGILESGKYETIRADYGGTEAFVDHVTDDQGVSGLTWKLNVTLPDVGYADYYFTDDPATFCTIGASGLSFGGGQLISVTAAADAALGEHYVGKLALPYITAEDDGSGAYYPGTMGLALIPVFIEVIEGDVTEYTYTYKLTYDLNGSGATGGPDPLVVTATHGPTTATTDSNTFTLDFTAPTRTGYVFKGWSNTMGTSNTVDYEDTPTGTKTITLTTSSTSTNAEKKVYAVWAKTYTVEYKNAGSDYPQIANDKMPSDTTAYESGDEVTVLGATDLNVDDEVMVGGTNKKVYAFKGWKTGSNVYYPGETNEKFNITADTTLTAEWEEVKYTIVYDGGGETIDTTTFASETLSNGAETENAANVPTVAGKTFQGWKINGSVDVAKGTQYTVDKAHDTDKDHKITLVAQWSSNDYEVTFNTDGGTWSSGGTGNKTTTGKYADKVKVPAADGTALTVSKTGYTFDAWYETDASGDLTSTKLDTANHTYGDKDGTVYKAKWIPIDYDVTYDSNGFGTIGTGVNTTTNHYGDTITVKTAQQAMPDIEGTQKWNGNILSVTVDGVTTKKQFDGWTPSDGGAATGTFSMPAKDVTLTAQWTNIYSVTYSDGGESGVTGLPSPDKVDDIPSGTSHSISSTEPTRTGYTFKGWISDVSGDNKTYKKDGTNTAITVNSNITLTATWEINKYTVTYANGGHGTVASGYAPMSAKVDYMADYTPVVAANVAITSGGTWEANGSTANAIFNDGTQKWLFKHWTASGGTASGDYTAGGTVEDITDNLLLTAVWEEVFVVSFDPNGGSNSPAAQQGVTGTKITLPDPGTQTDAEFDGWYDGTTKVGGKGDEYEIKKTVTLTAKWNGTSKVKFDLDGGTPADGKALPATNPQTGKTGTAITLPDNMVKTAPDDATKTGYTFRGWSKGSKSTSASDAVDISTIKFPADAGKTDTYYAIWVPDVTVTFDANDGAWAETGNPTTKSSAGEPGVEKFTVPADPARAGYAFKGWFDAKTGGTAVSGITATTQHNYPAAAKTYYAQWDKLYTVRYDMNDPTNDTDKFTGAVTSDSTVNNTNDVPSKKAGETVTVPKVEDTKGNYVFKGWKATSGTTQGNANYTVANGDAATTVDATANQFIITLTAQWQIKTNVTYNTGSGAFADSTTSKAFKGDPTDSTDTYQVPADPTRSGYTFTGWKKTGAAAVDATKKQNTTHTFPATDEVYEAQWEVNKYTVTFVWNTTAHSHTADEVFGTSKGNFRDTITLPANNPPSMVGYTFGGWYKDAGCSDGQELVLDGTSPDTYPDNDTTKFYAKWTANTYKVTYDPGKAGDNASATIADLDAATTSDQDFKNFTYDGTSLKAEKSTIVTFPGTAGTGWHFQNWLSNDADGSKTYAADADLGTNKKAYNFTLTAQWKIDVSYDANLPETSPAGADSLSVPTTPAQIVPDGSLSEAQIARPGDLTNWTFDGWYTTPKTVDGVADVKVSTSTKFPVPATIYARWTPKQYTVSFVDNDTSDKTNPNDVKNIYGHKFTLPDPTGTKTGYTFEGWFYEDENAGTSTPAVLDADKKFTITKDETLYGHWTPVDVTIIYQTDVGKALGNDTKKYDATDYTAKHNNTITKADGVTTGGWNAGETIFTDGSGNRWQFNGWDILKADGSVLKQVASQGPINPLNTTNGVVPPSGSETAYKLTMKANWTQLYNVTYVNGGHGKVDSTKNLVNHAQFAYTVLGQSDVIGKADDNASGSWDVTTKLYFTDDSGHWKFLYWEADDAAKTHYLGGQQIDPLNRDTVLTAVWEKTYQVTLGEAASAGDGSKLSTTNVSRTDATFNKTDLNTGTGGLRTIWVKAGDKVDITALSLRGAHTGEYIFAQWSPTASTGSFGDKGAAKEVTDFTPTADTTLTPTYWLKPTLSGAQKHHLNKDVDAVIADAPWSGGKNTLPVYTWTKNDADLDDPQIQIQLDGTNWVDLTVGTGKDVVAATDAAGNVTYTFQRDYLVNLPVPDGVTNVTFKVRVNSHTPSGGTETNREADLTVYVTPDPLNKVDIQVKDGTNTTVKVNVTAQDGVKYLSHELATIEPTNKLTYTWYVSDNSTDKPDQHKYTTTLANRVASVTNAKTAADALGDKISDEDTTDNFVNITGKNEYKGRWLYAVVAASGTGYGAVITNAIAVDYDAKIAVNKDGSAIAGTAAGGYRVFLVPSTTAAADLSIDGSGNLTGTGVVSTTNDGTNNVYATADSALTGGVAYNVYVNKVEGDFNAYLDTGIDVNTQINTAGAGQTIDFYSVNKANPADPHHLTDSANKPVGETFDATGTNAMPDTAFTTDKSGGVATTGSGPISVPNENGVLKGSNVTAKTTSKAWGQDYHVDWNHGTTNANLSFNETNKQTKDAAHDTGYTKVTNIQAKTWIGAELHQNAYEVTGNIWAMDSNNKAAVRSDTGHVPTLTYKNGENTYTFNPTNTNYGRHKTTVTFKVPRSGVTGAAIAGQYVITAQPQESAPKTTILKYIPGQNLTSATDDSIKAVDELDPKQTLAGDVAATGGINDNAFTIVIAASSYVLEVRDVKPADGTGDGSQDTVAPDRSVTVTQATPQNYPTSGAGYVGMTWAVDYAYTAGETYRVRVTNKGNTDLTLYLDLQKTVGSDPATSIFSDAGTTLTGADSDTDANGVVFGDLAGHFDLDPGQSQEFTVTIPKSLDVDEAATYDFLFSSKERGVVTNPYGPSVAYRLTQAITPLEVQEVKAVSTSTDASGKKIWEPSDLKISGNVGAAIPSGVRLPSASETDPDVAYDWYAVPHGTAVDKAATDASGKLTLANGDTPDAITPGTKGVDAKGLTYTEHDDHKGMDIYLVARGSGTGNVIKAYLTDPPQIIVNYDLDIRVLENEALTKTEGNYVVYLWPDKVRQADGTMANNTDTFSATNAKTIQAEMGTNTADGLYTAKGLDPDVTYTIYTNAVGGATGANLQDSKVTASYTNFQNKKSPEVIYHDVTVNNTTVSNGAYDSAVGANNPDPFLTTYATEEADRDNSTLPSGIKNPAASVGAAKTEVATTTANKWVQKGTTVNLEYAKWDKDYTLSWTGATTGSADVDKDPTSASTATKKVESQKTVIKTQLALNLYELTAYVVGDNGAVDEINLTGTSTGALNITTAASGSGKWMGTASALSSIPAKGSAVFSVPAGSYEVTAKKSAGTTIDGYRDEHNVTSNPTSTDKLAVTVNANHEMDILIHAAGQSLEAADNAKDQGLATANVTTSAGYSDEGTASNSGTQEITLPYGYDAKSFTLTVKNTSASNLDVLYDVTMEKTSMPTAQITVTDPDKAVSIPLDGTADMNQNDSTVVTINIAEGLGKGTYTSVLKFTFKNDETSPVDPLPTATYTLKVTVEPAKFTAVTMKASDNSDISTMIPYGVDLVANTFTTSDPNLGNLTASDTNYLTPGTDYHYEWYATAADATLSDDWASGALTTTATKIGTGDTLDKAVIAAHPGEKIWLAIVAEDGKNVINAAVTSAATGYQPVVKIAVDTVTLTKDTKPADGDYTVTLNNGTNDIPTAWSDDLGGFIPVDGDGDPIALKADTKLSVKASKAKGLTEQADLSGVELTVNAPSTTVNYYTVNAVATRDFEAIPGLGETFGGDADALPSISFNLVNTATTALDNGTPVLSGQKVTAKATEWSQDYKLTWHTATGATAPDPADNAYVATATGAKTMTAKGDAQATATAQAVGASGEVSVGAKTYIGGRLDQNFYYIKGTVKGTGTLSFAGLDMKGAEDATLKQWAFPNADGKENATANTSGTGNTLVANDAASRNETVTFKVVAGQFNVSVTPATGTVVKSMQWETAAAVNDVTTLTGNTVAADGTEKTYNFVVQLLATELKLGVNETASNKQAVSTTTQTKGATNALTRYFSYIHKAENNSQTGATSTFPLVLENPGNKDLSVGMEVFYFNATDKAALTETYLGTASNWEGASAVNTPIFTAVDGTAAKDLPATNGSTETVLALTDLMGTSVTVPKGAAYSATAGDNSSVAVGTVTLGEDAWAKDRGAFVFRFKGTTDDAADGAAVVYYVLDLTVAQLPIKEVQTQMKDKDGGALADTDMPGVGDVLEAKGFDATTDKSLDNVTVQRSSTNTDTTTQAATEAKLTDNDIHFAWVSVPGGTTGDILARFQVNANGVLERKNTTDKVLSTNANAKTYTMTADELDKDLYLIAYAPNTTAEPQKTNATGMAISGKIQAKRTVGVKISLDGPTNYQNGGSDGKGPGYTVFLVEQGGTLSVTKNADGTYTTGAGTWATTWNNTAKAYQAAIDLGTTYEIYAPSYKDGENFVNTDLTLGKKTGGATGVDELQVVPYFSVVHTANVAVDNTYDKFVSYLPSGVANTDNAIQNALTVAVSDDKGVTDYTRGDTLAGANVPVLSGMNVQVTVDAAKQSANTAAAVQSWSQATDLHTLTTKGWKKDATDSATTVEQTKIAYPAGAGDPAKYLIQSGHITVTAAKDFSATLKQELFDVTFKVVDNTPAESKSEPGYAPASVEKVRLVPDTAKETAGAAQTFEVTIYGTAATDAGYIGNGMDGSAGTDGATVTIKGVPKGGFEVQADMGNKSKLDGFTWNAEDDALNDPKDPGKIVDTGITDAVNKHEGNTVQIQYSSFAVQWKDNFVTTTGAAHDTDFFNSTGFQKVDATTTAGPFLALKEGYSDDENAVLTYKVRVENTGAMPLANFWINQTDKTNFIADLTKVTITRSDGTVETDVNVSTKGSITLGVGDRVDFTVTIPSGDDEKAPRNTNYSSAFQVKSDSSENISKSTYTPAYQVKPIVAFDEGSALVIYGNNKFEPTPVQVAPAASWDTTAYKPDFQFSILTEAETRTYLKLADGDTLADNVYYNSEGTNKVPAWVSIAQATGALSFDATGDKHATEVNVRTKTATKWDDYQANEVDNEMVFYLKAVDQQTGATYYTKYTVNVEPGELKIDPIDFAPTDPVGGQSVDKGAFTYTKVTNEDGTYVVIPEATAPAVNTGNGNDPSQETPTNGKVFVPDGEGTPVHTATWKVDPASYKGGETAKYTFTVDYKPGTPEQWNFKPDTYEKEIEAAKPPLGLKFSDVRTNADKVIGGTLTTTNEANAGTLDAAGPAQTVTRTGEYVIYLDTEPTYTVTLTSTGDPLYKVKIEAVDVSGITYTDLSVDGTHGFADDEEVKEITLDLSAISGTPGNELWAGPHTITLKASGENADGTETATAEYKLTFVIKPRPIAQAHVTDLTDPTPGGTPDTQITITAKDPDGNDIKPLEKDRHDNTPITPDVKWTPTPDGGKFKDGEDYTVTITLPADPNYTFEDLTERDEEPNYTLNGKTDANDDPTLVDEDLKITITTKDNPPVPDQNKQVEFEKVFKLPKKSDLRYHDVRTQAGTAGKDTAPGTPAKSYQRDIEVVRGETLGKYTISLGAYDNTVKVTKVEKTSDDLLGLANVKLTPATTFPETTVGELAQVNTTPAGATHDYELDLSDVYTVKLDTKTYVLQFTATGEDAYGTKVTATYTLNVKVKAAPVPELKFHDTHTQDATTTEVTVPANGSADKNYKRTVTVKWDEANGRYYPLGKYTIDLGAYNNDAHKVTLGIDTGIDCDGVAELNEELTKIKLDPIPVLEKDGDRWRWELDLSGVDYTKLTAAEINKDGLSLKLHAKGEDPNNSDPATNKVEADYTLEIKFEKPPKPQLMFDDVKHSGDGSDKTTTGPAVNDTRNINLRTGQKPGTYTIYLGAYNGSVKDVKFTSTPTDPSYNVTPDTLPVFTLEMRKDMSTDQAQAFELDLSGMDTSKPGRYTLILNAIGVDPYNDDQTTNEVSASYILTLVISQPGGGGGGGGSTECPNQVNYLLGLYGTTKDSTMEKVNTNGKVKTEPKVTALEGYKFLGWSLVGPTGNAEQDAKRLLVDPKTVTITADTNFYAVYQVIYKVPEPPFHKHYVIGYPNGNFGPADNIDRGSVATIIARAVLPNFVEGADYGNPGGYADVEGHWAESAIAYCTKYGVFKGYDDGTFKPGQPISRQELALVMARISGVKKGTAPFSDMTDAGDWAKDGIYTAYVNGWVNGYTDGTFKPVNPIRRDETVKIFNAYLGRGVDAEGLSALTEYVHSGVASNNNENGTTEYMTWPDVTKDQWAYFEIIEAANDHEFEVDSTQPKGYAVPEKWTKCWIDEKWRYHDDANDGGPTAVVSALLGKYGLAD